MGGFAALHAALQRPDLFGAVGALSPAMFVSVPADRAWIHGPDPAANDPLALVRAGRARDLRVFVGYGDNDYAWIREAASALASRLAASGTPIEPEVVPGGHETATWRALAPAMLTTLAQP